MNHSLDQLLTVYTEAARLHDKSSEGSDYRAANNHYDVLVGIYRELKRRGAEALTGLLKLLDDSSPAVRLWAAFHTLEIAPAVAERVLEDLAKGAPSLARLSAATTLAEWRKGSLIIPS